MRIAIGRPGLLDGPVGARLRELQPGWKSDAPAADEWAGTLRSADVAMPVTAPITDALLEGSSVRFVQQFGTGVDTIDLAACRRRGIPVANVPSAASANADSVAELAVTMTLSLVRHLDDLRAAARTGTPPTPVPMIAGREMLLVGLGGIGAAVAIRLAPFGVRLRGVRAHPQRGGPAGVDDVRGPEALDDLLALADVVICCAPPSGDDALFTTARFAAMKRGAMFVNVSRGSLVDEAALLAALEDGTIAGAGLDVIVHEPPDPNDPLVSHPRVIVTPHVGGGTLQSLRSITEAAASNIARFERGEEPRWRIA